MHLIAIDLKEDFLQTPQSYILFWLLVVDFCANKIHFIVSIEKFVLELSAAVLMFVPVLGFITTCFATSLAILDIKDDSTAVVEVQILFCLYFANNFLLLLLRF